VARSNASHYRPQETSEADLAVMRRIDELHLEHPSCGSRMLCECWESHYIGFYPPGHTERYGITPAAFYFLHLYALELTG
jgi:hypothetical protein